MRPDPVDVITSSTYCSMAHLLHRLTAGAAPGLSEHGLSPTTFMILGQVYSHPGLHPAELARRCGLSAQHLAGILDRAEADGLLIREGQRGRGHRTRVTVSPAGIRAMVAAWPVIEAAGSPAALRLDEADTAALHRLLVAGLDAPTAPVAQVAADAPPTDTPDTPGSADDTDVVVLVDPNGTPTGTAPRPTVHTAATPLHLAFSTYLCDADGRVLLTRRALSKTTWPGVWTNAACGHLRPGETAAEAAVRRVPEELGTAPLDLRTALPDFRYRAVDASGVVENEICPVLVGRIDPAALRPQPAEVAAHAWVAWPDLLAAARALPHLLSPWCVEQVLALGENPWETP